MQRMMHTIGIRVHFFEVSRDDNRPFFLRHIVARERQTRKSKEQRTE